MPVTIGADLAPGDVVDGKFEILAVLGAGAMGTVHLAEHRAVGRQVAIKVLGFTPSADPDLAVRFRAEARSSAAIGHPNIVDVLDAGELPDGRPYIVMEHLVGRSLFAELHACGPLPVDRACAIVRDVARAVAAAHAAGIIHRDLKPENIMLVVHGGAEAVKVLDFGISAQLGGSRLTAPGILLGTPEYMAPEQAIGGGPHPGIDIYALGALLFELLAGVPPFSGNPVEILVRKASTPAPRLDQATDGRVPALVADLAAACLEIDPNRRPRSATLVAERLEALGADDSAEQSQPRPIPMRGPESTTSGVLVTTARTRARRSGWTSVAALALAAGMTFVIDRGLLDAAEESPSGAAHALEADTLAAIDRSPLADASLVADASLLAACGDDEETWTLSFESASATPVVTDPSARAAADAPEPARRFDAAACERSRRLAVRARGAQDWHSVLHHTGQTGCWAGSGQRDRLRVKALLELGRYDQCASHGRRLTNPDWRTRWWLRRCEERAGRKAT